MYVWNCDLDIPPVGDDAHIVPSMWIPPHFVGTTALGRPSVTSKHPAHNKGKIFCKEEIG